MSLRSFTLHDLINRNARWYGSNTALVFGDQRITHAQYAGRTARLAAGLAAAGVGQGDRLAILAPNCLEYVDLFGAAARLGAIVVPINWRLSAEEVAYVIEDVAPRVLIVADEFQALLPQRGLDDMLRYTLGVAPAPWQPVSALYRERDKPAADLPGLADDSGLLIIHTAAVGGRPRGALLSHRGLIAASMQTQLAWHLTAADVNLGVLPLFHVAAIGFMLATQHAGGATLLMTRFDPPSLVKHIDEDGGSLIGTFPPMLGALLDAAAAQGSALARLRVVSGIDVPETIARLRNTCPQASFWSAYGQTETSGSVSLAPFDERPGSAGRAYRAEHGRGGGRTGPPLAHRRHRRDRGARADGVPGLLALRSRQRLHAAQRLAPHRRHGAHRCRRLPLVQRAFTGQGVDQAGGRERLSS